MFNKNDVIKWTGEENGETFSYVGKVKSHKGGRLSFIIESGGEIEIDDTDGKIEKIDRPFRVKRSSSKLQRPTATSVEKPKKTRKPRAKKGGTKKQLALVIVKEVLESQGDKSDAIERLMTELEMSKAGAQTYFYNCKKELGI